MMRFGLRLVVVVWVVMRCLGQETPLPKLIGSELIGSGYNHVTEEFMLLPTLALRFDTRITSSEECQSSFSQAGKNHCWYNVHNQLGYLVPFGVTVIAENSFLAQDALIVVENAYQLLEIFETKVVDEDDDFFGGSIQAEIVWKYYSMYYTQTQQLALQSRTASIYRVFLEKGMKFLFHQYGASILDSSFAKIIDDLPETFDENPEKYFQLIGSYGTHLVTGVEMGGSLEMMMWFNSCFTLGENYNMTIVIEASKNFFSGWVEAEASFFAKVNSCFANNAKYKFAYQGGRGYLYPPWKSHEWEQSVYDAPVPVKTTITELWKLVRLVSPEKGIALKTATDRYVEHALKSTEEYISLLKSQGQVIYPDCCKNPSGPHPEEKRVECNSIHTNGSTFGDTCMDKIKSIFKPSLNPDPQDPPTSFDTLSTSKHAQLMAEDREPPKSALLVPGYNTITGECKSSVLSLTYNNREEYYNALLGTTFLKPDQLVLSDYSIFQVKSSPLVEITNVTITGAVEAWFEISWKNIHPILALVKILLPPDNPLINWGAGAEVTVDIQAAIEGGKNVVITQGTKYQTLEVVSKPFSTLTNQNQALIQQEFLALPNEYDYSEYERFLNTWGTAWAARAQYGGEIFFTFVANAELFASAEVHWRLQMEIVITTFQCLLGLQSSWSVTRELICSFDYDFWSSVSLTITVAGGIIPESLGSFNYTNWLESTTKNPVILDLTPHPITELFQQEPQLSSLRESLKTYTSSATAQGEASSCFPDGTYANFKCVFSPDCKDTPLSCCKRIDQ